jgi:hypothetical protein
LKRVLPWLALAVTTAGSLSVAAPRPSTDREEKTRPETEEAKPSVALKKLADNAKLRLTDEQNRTESTNNLKKIGQAVIDFADNHMGQLPGDLVDKKGKAILSWRVVLLSFLEQGKLSKEFKLDEPWDSRHNLKLLGKMPQVFRSPRVTLKHKGYTVYQVFTGGETVFQAGKGFRFPASIPDGTSNTILAVEATAAVPWTKPADIPFDSRNAFPDFGKAYGQTPQCVLFDGSTRTLDLRKLTRQTLKHAVMPADGFPLGSDW